MASPASGAHADVSTALFKKLYPADFLQRHLEEQVREDGRGLHEARPVSLATDILSQAQGSALVRFGAGTMVTAAVSAHITEPHHDRPHEGFVVPSLELAPLCSPQYRPGPPSDEAQVLVHYLQLFLNHADALPRTALCIEPGVAVWSVHVDIVCVAADGSVLDAAALAAVAALATCRLPRVLRCESSQRCICARTRTEPLPLTHLPMLVSFGVYDSTYLLADPSAFEASLLAATTYVGIAESGADQDEDVFFLRHMGAATARCAALHNAALLEHIIHEARTRADVLRKLLRASLTQP